MRTRILIIVLLRLAKAMTSASAADHIARGQSTRDACSVGRIRHTAPSITTEAFNVANEA
eukprot:12869734-Alexandrium_andersonii.AAC.1